MFSVNSYATVWKTNRNGEPDGRCREKFSSYRISTSKRTEEGGYETDFSSYVTFVGKAKPVVDSVPHGGRIQILSCGVNTRYNEGKVNYDFVVFDAAPAPSHGGTHQNTAPAPAPTATPMPVDASEELPF